MSEAVIETFEVSYCLWAACEASSRLINSNNDLKEHINHLSVDNQ